MKFSVAKATLFILPLVAFTSQSFAAQELVVAATSQQEAQLGSHDVKHEKNAHKKHQKEAVTLLSDDESIAALSSTKELRKRYQE